MFGARVFFVLVRSVSSCFVIHHPLTAFPTAYLPEGTSEASPGGASYDESLASLFWGLSVPAAEVPPEGGKALKDKLQFCLDKTKDWDPA